MLRVLKVFTIIFTLLLALTIMAAIPFLYRESQVSASEMDSKEDIMNRHNTGVTIVDRNGEVFYRFYQARHVNPVPIAEIPEYVKQAVIAAEDKEFYQHEGYSVRAIAAAMVANIRHQSTSYGGSTITQQLAKNSFLDQRKDYHRKLQELLLARQIEERYTKDEILEMYLNSVYFGEGAFGIGEAAKAYYNKPLAQLSIAESAMLAGVLVAPSSYSPISGSAEKARERQEIVLKNMIDQGYITSEQRDAALVEKLVYTSPEEDTTSFKAPHFAYMVRQELINRYGEEQVARSGFVVHTTIDLKKQAEAEKIVAEHVQKISNQDVSNGAAIVMNPTTGEILALVGSKDWNNPTFGKVNIAQAMRQPGSSFKPIVYLAGLEKQEITPASILQDVPTTFGKNYRPENYDKRFRGSVTVRRALATSLNVSTVSLQQKIGVPATRDMASRLGITTLTKFSDEDLSVSLGSAETPLLQMTGAYATFANQGSYNAPTLITQIFDKSDVEVFTYKPEPKKVVEPKYTYLLTSILSDNAARKEVFGDNLTISRPAAVKTGTSQDYRDSWTFGYTPSLTVGVWVGNNDGHAMNNVAGALGAAPIWRALMENFLVGTPVQEFTRPEGVTQMKVCRGRGLKVDERWTVQGDIINEVFAQGTEPTQPCYTPTPSPSPTAEPTPVEEVILPMGGEPGELQPLPTLEPTPEATPSPTPTPTPSPSIPPPTPPGRGGRDR